MKYYRLDNGGYCKTLFRISYGATEITEEEYNANVPPEPENPEISNDEALEILLGGGEA